MEENRDQTPEEGEEYDEDEYVELEPIAPFRITIRGLFWIMFWVAVCVWACVRIPPNGDRNWAIPYFYIMIAIVSLIASFGGLTAKPWRMLLVVIIAVACLSILFIPVLVYSRWLGLR